MCDAMDGTGCMGILDVERRLRRVTIECMMYNGDFKGKKYPIEKKNKIYVIVFAFEAEKWCIALFMKDNILNRKLLLFLYINDISPR